MGIYEIDLYWLKFFNSFVGVNPAFDFYLRNLTNWSIFRTGWLLWFFCWTWFAGHDDKNRRIILEGLAGVTVAVALGFIGQRLFVVHNRPTILAAELGIKLPNNIDAFHWSVNSFPSDTAILVFGLATVVWSVSRWAGVVAFIWVTVTAALPRIYFAYHYPSDIVAGCVLAVTIVLLAQRSKVMELIADKLLLLEKRNPQFFYPLAFYFLFELAYMFADIQVIVRGINVSGV